MVIDHYMVSDHYMVIMDITQHHFSRLFLDFGDCELTEIESNTEETYDFYNY